MAYAVHATGAVTATAFAKRYNPNPPRAIISQEPEWAWSPGGARVQQPAAMSRNPDGIGAREPGSRS
jgi:hypothetical protein